MNHWNIKLHNILLNDNPPGHFSLLTFHKELPLALFLCDLLYYRVIAELTIHKAVYIAH